LIKFLVIVLGVGWLLGQLVRYFLRTKLAKFAQQVSEVAREQQREQHHLKKKQKDIQGGEYVDYEEVKE
jgi:hypothetical protein